MEIVLMNDNAKILTQASKISAGLDNKNYFITYKTHD